jgi:hypothetical protein
MTDNGNDRDDRQGAAKDPSDWVTGDDPMTDAQRSYLETLSERADVPVEENLTKAEASERIDELRDQTGQGQTAGGSGGSSGGQDGAQKDPDQWVTGDEPMTPAQRSYLETLARQAGEAVDDNMTKAEASKRIDELRGKASQGDA